MKKVLFIIVFNLFSFCLFAQSITLKGRYVADMLKYNYNGWEISRGDTINYKNSAKVIVKKFRKQVYMETYIIYTIVQNENGDAIVFDLDEEINKGNIITPTGIKVRNGYENDNLRYTRDSAIKEWKLNILPIKDGKVNYTLVLDIPNVSKNEIYTRCKLWFAHAFKDSKQVIQVDDKEAGRIVAKYIHSTFVTSLMQVVSLTLRQTLDVSIKDNKARIIISDISVLIDQSRVEMPIEDWKLKRSKLYENADESYRSLISSFENFMLKPTTGLLKSDDNW
jgi:hypothetical protein